MRESTAKQRDLNIVAKIHAQTTHSHEPQWFTTAPVGAIKKILERTGWQMQDVDLFEVNEAFACVTLAAMKELDIPHDKVNIHGGACALGHPIGASGARVVSTLIEALRRNNLKRGIASLCIGGGEATALAIEIV
jgi:acetyl-CoA C-acetyltransferase